MIKSNRRFLILKGFSIYILFFPWIFLFIFWIALFNITNISGAEFNNNFVLLEDKLLEIMKNNNKPIVYSAIGVMVLFFGYGYSKYKKLRKEWEIEKAKSKDLESKN